MTKYLVLVRPKGETYGISEWVDGRYLERKRQVYQAIGWGFKVIAERVEHEGEGVLVA